MSLAGTATAIAFTTALAAAQCYWISVQILMKADYLAGAAAAKVISVVPAAAKHCRRGVGMFSGASQNCCLTAACQTLQSTAWPTSCSQHLRHCKGHHHVADLARYLSALLHQVQEPRCRDALTAGPIAHAEASMQSQAPQAVQTTRLTGQQARGRGWLTSSGTRRPSRPSVWHLAVKLFARSRASRRACRPQASEVVALTSAHASVPAASLAMVSAQASLHIDPPSKPRMKPSQS